MALPPTSRTSALRWLQGSDEAEAEPEPEPEPVVEEAKPTAEELADRPKTLYALEPAAGRNANAAHPPMRWDATHHCGGGV